MVDTVYMPRPTPPSSAPTPSGALPSGVGTRERLVDAGVALLEEAGPDNVGLRAVARRAGVSHGAPRRYFPTHRSLLAAVARTGIEDLDRVIGPTLTDAARTPRDRLAEAGSAYVTFAQRRARMFELMFRHDLLDQAGEYLRSLTRPLVSDLHRVVVAAHGPVSPPESLWDTAIGLWTSLHGIAVLTANRTLEPLDVEPDADRLVAAAVDTWLASAR